MKNKLLTSLIVLGGLALVSPAAHAQAYPYCNLGWDGNALYASPGGPQVGYAPGGAPMQVTQVGPQGWLQIAGPWGGGWVAHGFVDPGCVPVNCCAAPPPVVPCCAPPPVVTRHRERHVYDQSQHHEYETESGGGYAAPYSNGNGYHGNGNGHDKGEYQDNNNGYNGNGHNGNGQDQAPAPEQQNGNGNGNNY